MQVPPIPTNEPSFGYKHQLKTAYKKGLLPTVKYGIYGTKLTKENIIRYFSQFVDIKNRYIDGNQYIKEALKNLGGLYDQMVRTKNL